MKPENNADDLKHYLLGTCAHIGAAVESLELDENTDWEDEMVAAGIETCLGCGWWHEICDLVDVDDDTKVGYCDDCREDYQ